MTMNVVRSFCTLVQTASNWPKHMLFLLELKGDQGRKGGAVGRWRHEGFWWRLEMWQAGHEESSCSDGAVGLQDTN